MRRCWVAAVLALVALALAVVPALAQGKVVSGVDGTVLDTTCSTGCPPPCPPPPSCRTDLICTQRAAAAIACPLHPQGSIVCPQVKSTGCPPPPSMPVYPPYEGDAATVLVRRAGSTHVLLRLPVEGGRFHARLAPGRYVFRAHVALPCWTGSRQLAMVDVGQRTPVTLEVSDGCVVHSDAG